MNQPIPDVTMADLDRIVRATSRRGSHGQVVNILIRYGRGDGGKNRVCAAALKLADGDIEQLEHYDLTRPEATTATSSAWAEYPAYMDCVLGPNGRERSQGADRR